MKLRQLKLSQRGVHTSEVLTANTLSGPVSGSHDRFDIGKHTALVPICRENEVDSYFGAFERIAMALKWPSDVWPLLLQSKIHNKAQEVVSALPLEDTLDYDT